MSVVPWTRFLPATVIGGGGRWQKARGREKEDALDWDKVKGEA